MASRRSPRLKEISPKETQQQRGITSSLGERLLVVSILPGWSAEQAEFAGTRRITEATS